MVPEIVFSVSPKYIPFIAAAMVKPDGSIRTSVPGVRFVATPGSLTMDTADFEKHGVEVPEAHLIYAERIRHLLVTSKGRLSNKNVALLRYYLQQIEASHRWLKDLLGASGS